MPGRANYSAKAFNLNEVHLPRKYNRCVRLTSEKRKDLQAMVPFLDIKGRNWCKALLKEQQEAEEESSGGKTEDEGEGLD